MISGRKRKGKETHAYSTIQMGELYRSQINGITANMRSTKHQNIQTDPQPALEPPIFNIHIHIPPFNQGNFQVYLPRLHPIVHLHFDDIARKLELRKGQNEEVTYQLFKSLLAMTSPTYGDVKLYTSHRSEEGGFKEVLARTTRTTTTSITSESRPAGCGIVLNKTISYSQKTVNSKRSNCDRNDSSVRTDHERPGMDNSQINRNPRKRSMSDLAKEFKLKKAVVVLTDICKSEYYKNLIKTSAGVSNEERIEESRVVLDRSECEQHNNSQLCEKRFIKTEIESPEPESPNRLHEENEAHYASSSKIIPPTNEVGSVKSEMNVNYDMTKSLISLVEGCNFSEILHRFKVKKCEEHLVESVKNLDGPTVENIVSNSEHSCNRETREQDSNRENNFVVDENLGGENAPGGVESELTIKDDLNWSMSNDESKELSPCVDVKLPTDSLNASTNTQSSDVEHDLLIDDEKLNNDDNDDGDDGDDDECEVSEVLPSQKIIRATSNSEIEILSCGTSPFLIPINRFQFIKSNENNSECNSNINLQLELIKKEMARRNMNSSNSSSNKKKGKGVKKKALKSPSEGKKSKDSKQQKTDNFSQTDDYIPLQATGPTRFAVAPLNKVSPYKSHDARNFKNEMLFGNRVNRFQNADHLRTYKMKKSAGKRTSI